MPVTDPVLQAARLLEEHHTEPWSLDELAASVGYSPYHLNRVFRARLGLPPMQYLATQRFDAARRLLLTTDASVTDICMTVGFSSLGTFTRRFGAEVGLGPSQFRRLPDRLADGPPRAGHVPGGDRDGGTLTGSVHLSEAATARLGPSPRIYVGLFPARAARGLPVSGSHLPEPEPFCFVDVPPGRYWVLASAFPDDDVYAQLTATWPVTGGVAHPVTISAGPRPTAVEVWLDVPHEWATPITVALPALTTSTGATRPAVPLPRPPR